MTRWFVHCPVARRSQFFWFASALLGLALVGLAAAEEPQAPRRSRSDRGAAVVKIGLDQPPAQKRLREGARLENIVGRFRTTGGDRVTFYPSDEAANEMLVLENLALERVARAISQDHQREWSVTGSVTEFRGGNYLLVERAVVKTSTTRP